MTTRCDIFDNALSPKRRDLSEFYEGKNPIRVRRLQQGKSITWDLYILEDPQSMRFMQFWREQGSKNRILKPDKPISIIQVFFL